MSEIKNLIFDMGNVLIRFDAAAFVARLGLADADSRLLLREVFRGREWAMLDWGSADEAEAWKRICLRLPNRLHEAARELVFRWDDPILPMDGMETLVRELSANGYRLYLLSNASVRQGEYWPRVPGNECFSGTLVSANVRLVKPQPEIFYLALERFGIRAQESVFIDDSSINVEAACHVGMQGFVFHGDADALRAWLREQDIKV